MQVDKIEVTYTYLQEQSSGSNDPKLNDEMSDPDCCLNQDLVKLAGRIKLRKGEKPDYEMVLILLVLFPSCKYKN